MNTTFSYRSVAEVDSATSKSPSAFSLALILQTKERNDVIRWYVPQVQHHLENFAVDLLIVGAADTAAKSDGSSALPNSPHIFYFGLSADECAFSLERKIFNSITRFSPKYDYLWFCRDRSAPDLTNVYDCLQKAFIERDCDFVVLYPHGSAETAHVQKHYTDPCEFIREQYGNMISLGSIVFRTSFLQKLIIAQPLNAVCNASFWMPSALFAYIANIPFKCDYIGGRNFVQYPKEQFSSWMQDSFLELWATRWKTIIAKLPSRYDGQKSHVICHENWSISPFTPYFLLAAKSMGGLKLTDVWRRKQDIDEVTQYPFLKIFCIALIPRCIAKMYFKLKIFFTNLSQKNN
ncbi:hypothetical protein [Desulfovibrio falkowii]|uniref:hypothetical protein n=1 Tax=Desulfovibrio falkowii TaxID=3136602 RepID=UPI0038B3E6AB